MRPSGLDHCKNNLNKHIYSKQGKGGIMARDLTIPIRVSDEEKAIFETMAARNGFRTGSTYGVSAYVRWKVLNEYHDQEKKKAS